MNQDSVVYSMRDVATAIEFRLRGIKSVLYSIVCTDTRDGYTLEGIKDVMNDMIECMLDMSTAIALDGMDIPEDDDIQDIPF